MVSGKKLVVKVVGARNLMPKDGEGSCSPFVQVVFGGQRKTTRVINKNHLNPMWEEAIEFPIHDLEDMANEILEINVFDNSKRAVGRKGKFLGRVCLHGSTFVKQGEEAIVAYKLDKRSLFSLVKGELSLSIYYTDDAASLVAKREANNDGDGAAADTPKKKVVAPTLNEGAKKESTIGGGERGGGARGAVGDAAAVGKPSAKSIGQPPSRPPPITSPTAVVPPPYVVPSTKSSGLPPPSPPSRPPPMTTPTAVVPPPYVFPSTKSSGLPPPSTPKTTSPPPPSTPKSPPRPAKRRENSSPSCDAATRPHKLPYTELPRENSSVSTNPIDLVGQKLSDEKHATLHAALDMPATTQEPEPPAATEVSSPTAHELLPNTSDLPSDAPLNQTDPPAAPPSTDQSLETPPRLEVAEQTPSEAPSLEETSPEPQQPEPEPEPEPEPGPELYESVAEQEELEFDMKPARSGGGGGESTVIVSLPHVEVLKPTKADYALKDTKPFLGGDKTSNFDLVEKMHYLFVRVVKARSLLARDLAGNPHPYVRVVLGNQVAKTKTSPSTLHPEWNQVFAFGHHSDAGILEVSLWDCNIISQDGFLGAVFFDLTEIPLRMPPDSPLAPQWYSLEQKHGEIGTVSGDMMLSVWIGTQTDEAFSEAWQSDAGGHAVSTRSKVYLSPKLWYLRLHVIEAQDLQTQGSPRRLPDVSVKAHLGFQVARTRVAKRRSVSPFWNEDLILVASEPLEDFVLLTVEDHQGPEKHEVIGTARLPLDKVERRVDDRQVASKWFNLEPNLDAMSTTTQFHGRIHVRACFDGGYHVMDESTHLSSDLRPTAKQLWKAPIGVLELGILGAQNLLPMKNKDGRGSMDAYCVAKYGPKWVRTRTILDSLSPRWNEQYTWEVYDPCTVLTLCVFDNGDLESQSKSSKHSRIGKVRVRLSTLEVDRVYTISYPLLVLHPEGLKKVGDMEVAVRFSCVSMFNLIHTYTKPLLPRMHYLYPLSMQQQEVLRMAAMKMVALRLARSEPPLRPEVVQYMLDADSGMWSMRRSKANWFRISTMMGGFYAMLTWMKDIGQWRNPVTTLLVHMLFIILLCYPELILPTIFFYMFLIGLWQYRSRNRSPPHIDPHLSHADVADRDELDEEFDTVPTSKPPDVVRLRYERLRGIAGRIQMVLGDVATQGERLHGLLTWRDPRATSIFVVFCFLTAVWLYIAPFKVAVFLVGIHFMRHPRFRGPLPSIPLNFLRRLPAQTDRIL